MRMILFNHAPCLPGLHTFWIKWSDQLPYAVFCHDVSPLNCTQVKPSTSLFLSINHYFSLPKSRHLFQACAFFFFYSEQRQFLAQSLESCMTEKKKNHLFVIYTDSEVQINQFRWIKSAVLYSERHLQQTSKLLKKSHWFFLKFWVFTWIAK